MYFELIVFLTAWIGLTQAYIHPIVVQGRYFVDTVTNEPFYIKGVDYQPGGSSGVVAHEDPLSNPAVCARDVLLFQDLGINTIRVYSINTDLDHDACMSMLAAAGIYLVLDVNSPLPGHHLNRYDPLSTYNVDYLENVFKVVEQFAYYNNTLGFFAGNEVINDIASAKSSPRYVKAMIRDIKNYIEYNSPRDIPVGYSAADDLKYRISFSQYLECMYDSVAESVDFYGVNSYQWCGDQTFYSSGYNTLVDDYATYSRPIFFSEYGCNEVTPRKFGEIPSLYSTDMIDVFSGGLVYQYSQEPNNYGLVELKGNGDAKLLQDYFALKSQLYSLGEIDYYHVADAMKQNAKDMQNRKKVQKYGIPPCDSSYDNLEIGEDLPLSFADDLIEHGVQVKHGNFISLSELDLTSKYEIFDSQNHPYPTSKTIVEVVDYMSGTGYDKLPRIRRHKNGMYNDPNDNSEDDTDDDSDGSDYGSGSDSEEEEPKDFLLKASEYFVSIFSSVAKLFGAD